MIDVRFEMSGDQKTLCLTVNGHAGQAEAGHDIVCAAASILAYTTAQAVRTMHDEDKLARRPRIRLGSGNAVIACKPKAPCYAEALHTFSIAQVGYRLLAHNYPDYVRLTGFGRG